MTRELMRDRFAQDDTRSFDLRAHRARIAQDDRVLKVKISPLSQTMRKKSGASPAVSFQSCFLSGLHSKLAHTADDIVVRRFVLGDGDRFQGCGSIMRAKY